MKTNPIFANAELSEKYLHCANNPRSSRQSLAERFYQLARIRRSRDCALTGLDTDVGDFGGCCKLFFPLFLILV